MAFNNRLDFKSSLILTIKVKLRVIMDLLAKTIIMPQKVISNSEYLPRNLKTIKKCVDFAAGVLIFKCPDKQVSLYILERI